jgi:membrane-associated phospholipid phosphatase
VTSLHLQPPMTLARVTAVNRWILPAAVTVFGALALGALAGWLVWDEPISRWVFASRTTDLDQVFRELSFLGSTKVVLLVSAIAALLAARRCPRLALAIVAIALARPATEFLLKEFVSRPRPVGDRMVGGVGYSFPSGHPLATAASWGTLPLVAALYTRRRTLWWLIAGGVWALVVLVAMSRVYLGVHWTSDVVASIALAVVGVAVAERYVVRPACSCTGGVLPTSPGSGHRVDAHDVGEQAVEGPVLETTP